MFFEKMQTRKNDGFTLVELIVVIAILAILAGIGVPAYSGYVEKANIAADQQLVSEVANALTLHFYNNEAKDEGAVSIGLSTSGITAPEGFAANAMNAVYGAGAWSDMKLKHDGWAGAGTVQTVLNHFSSATGSLADIYSGAKKPTFANDIDNLFDMVKDVSGSIGGDPEKGAELVKGAASLTMSTGGKITNADDFANAWVSGTWDSSNFMTDGTYGAEANKLTGDALNQAIANAAVLKARNTVVAGFVRDQMKANMTNVTDAELDAIYDVFCNYNYELNGEETIVPLDVATILCGQGTTEDENRLNAQIEAVFGSDTEKIDIATGLAIEYFESPDAKNDALAYYAMMDTVNTVDSSSPETYWDEMSGAVSLYGSIARGEAELDDLVSSYSGMTLDGSSVVVTAMMKNGNLEVNVSPSTAQP